MLAIPTAGQVRYVASKNMDRDDSSEPDSSPVSRLSQGQLDCLRLVDEHLSSKEIAVELGISSHTVDQRIRGALQILGVERRSQAARCVSQELGPYQRLIHQSPHIVVPPIPPSSMGRSVFRFGTLTVQGRLVAPVSIPSRSLGRTGLPCLYRSLRGVTPGMS